jgi:tetratricopeptide (TPR) repeat protein
MRNVLNYLFLICLICSLSINVKAQSAEGVFDKYADFNVARMLGKTDTAFKLSSEILPSISKLSSKTQISFYNGLAKLYEDNNQVDKAQPFYEKVVSAAPDYYVAHLALGHIYLRTVDELAKKANAASGSKATNEQYRKAYVIAVNKVLPHLEKVQACDPYEENLALIKKLYDSIGNSAGFADLENRLKPMRVKCLDILDEN